MGVPINITFDTSALVRAGVIIRQAPEKIRILNGEPQGDGLWVIESIGEKRSVVNNRGESGIIEVSLSLKEYIETRSANPEIFARKIFRV